MTDRVIGYAPAAFDLSSPFTAAFSTVVTWMERHEQRRTLAEMDSRLLQDMGMDRVDALHEAAKPFWQA